MPWFDHRGRRVFARAGSVREAKLRQRGAQPVEADEAQKSVTVLVNEATDADLATVERLLQEEYVGPQRKSALEQLRKIRRQKTAETEGEGEG